MTAAESLTRPTPDDVLAVVTDALAIICEVPPGSLSRQTELAGIGADSLARVELAELVEERLTPYAPGLHVPDAELNGFRTIGETVDYLFARM
jgi:acyl carrier protein